MIEIQLTEEQIKALAPEIKRTGEAHRVGKEGALLLQVWPKFGRAAGKFIPSEAVDELAKIIRKYHV